MTEKFLSASISNRNFSDSLLILTTLVKNVLALLQSTLINTAYYLAISISLSVRLSACLYMCISASVCLYVCLRIKQ